MFDIFETHEENMRKAQEAVNSISKNYAELKDIVNSAEEIDADLRDSVCKDIDDLQVRLDKLTEYLNRHEDVKFSVLSPIKKMLGELDE